MGINNNSIEENIVLNAFLTPDSLVKAYASKTGPIDNNEVLPVDDLVIEINGNSSGVLNSQGNGVYMSNFYPQPNEDYELVINYNGEIINSLETVPDSVSITDGYIIRSGGYVVDKPVGNDGAVYTGPTELGYTVFTDDPGEENYYELTLLQKIFIYERIEETDELEIVGYKYRTVQIESDDYIIQAEGLNDFSPNTLLFSDKLCNGKEVLLSYSFITALTYDSDFYCIIRNTTESYYLYKKSLVKHLYNKGMIELQEFQELSKFTAQNLPAELYSNINNAFGIFAAYQTSARKMYFIE